MQFSKILAASAFAALLSSCAGGGPMQSVPAGTTGQSQNREAYTLTSAFTAVNTATGQTVRIFPTREVFQNFSVAPGGRVTQRKPGGGSSNLVYHNGPVQTAPKLYLVLWGSAWGTGGDPDGVASRLQSFYGVIGGSKWLNSVSQYTQSGGAHVGNSGNIFAGTWSDTGSNPPGSPSQSSIAAEATRAAAHFGDYSASASYVIAMPSGIKPSGFGSQYCAWHSSTSTSGGTIAYTNLPYMPDAGASCGVGSVNSPGTLDGVTIVGGHEQGETETDPQPNTGWLDSSGSENGDKCAWSGLENNSNAGGYPTQPLWSNASSSCVQSY